MKKKYLLIVAIMVLLIFLILYFFIQITLNGKEHVVVAYGKKYQELGAKASFFNKELSVEVIGNIDTQKIGEQQVFYQAKNFIGLAKKKKRVVEVRDEQPPKITLEGSSRMEVIQGQEFRDPGYKMIDDVDGNISSKVQIKGKVNTKRVGTYQLKYQGADSSNNKSEVIRTIKVVAKELTYKPTYDLIDNKPQTWWSGNKKDHLIPVEGAAATQEELKKYNAYYYGPDEKVIYLTFDEGSNDTYVKEIMDVLNKNQVKATFFFCGNFVKSHPDLMKALVKTGHSVGNHTDHHTAMYKYANKEDFATFLDEIKGVEQYFYEATGQPMDKVYREPAGNWSYRSLAIIKDLGYKSFFWSADYYDYAETSTKEYALDNYLKRYHNGAIYLIHPKNKGNYLALEPFIIKMKELGYRFDLVKNIN